MRRKRIVKRLLLACLAVPAAILAIGATALAVNDTTAPVISGFGPSGTVYTSSTTVTAYYSDPAPSSGIDTDPMTTMLHVDNKHINGCKITQTSISCQVSGLTAKAHKVEAFVCDMAGNCASKVGSFNVGDKTSPSVDSITVTSTNIKAAYSDPLPATGVDPAYTLVKVDGAAVSGCTATATGVGCPFPSGLTDGQHKVDVSIRDNSGNAGSGSGNFFYVSAGQLVVQPPAAVNKRLN